MFDLRNGKSSRGSKDRANHGCCQQVTSRDEAFLDLSLDIEQNSSISSCLRQFSASEMLDGKNKFSCETCCGLQEAERRYDAFDPWDVAVD